MCLLETFKVNVVFPLNHKQKPQSCESQQFSCLALCLNQPKQDVFTVIFKSGCLTVEEAFDTKVTDTETQNRKLVQFGDDLRWER